MAPDGMGSKERQEKIVSFVTRKSHAYAALILVVFMLGFLTGFIIWGKDTPRSVIARPNNTVDPLGIDPGQTSIEEQVISN